MSSRLLNSWLVLIGAVSATCTANLMGCGGGGSEGSAPLDAGVDVTSDVGTSDDATTVSDSAGSLPDGNNASDDATTTVDANNPADSGSATDASNPSDAGDASDGAGSSDSSTADASACPEGTACSNNGANGICSGGACVACASGGTSVGPDATCTSAYGGGATQYVCSAGSCIPGNCNVSSDCTTAGAPTCGFSTPNVCGGCTQDAQCTGGTICDTASSDANFGKCISSACPVTTSTTTACSLNASDVCCAGVCVPGNCCYPTANTTSACGASATCKAETPGETTGGGICTACAAVTGANPTYYVDPKHGSDATGTGNRSGSNACAFQTVTRALQVIGASVPSGTTISIVNSDGTGTVTVQGVATGTPPAGQERFPIILPTNVTLASSGGAVVIEVPAKTGTTNTTGIVLAGNPSAIVGGSGAALTIDGQAEAATTGVVVQSPAATLVAVVVQDFQTDGIVVSNAGNTPSAVTIDAGVQSNGNGVEGLLVGGSSTASITGSSAAPTEFNNNGAHGIDVRANAAITVTGNVGASPPSSATVTASGNTAADVWIQQTAGTSAKNTISGMVLTTSNGNGLRVVAGSNVTVRSSWILGNTGSGIDIENPFGVTGSAIANIDLGTSSSPGGNVLQAPPGGSVNGNAGICLAIAASANAKLAAQGNIFGGNTATPVNCASGGALRTATGLRCATHADVGGNIVAFPSDAASGNVIDVTQCTY